MRDLEYPDAVAGPYKPPERTFTDDEGRHIGVSRYGAGPVGDEFEALVEMYVAFEPTGRAKGIPPTDEWAIRQWLHERILTEGAISAVAWHGRDPVGHGTLLPDNGRHELVIFVRATYRNAGVGTGLLEALLGAGREAGISRVWLTVKRRSNYAIDLYENVGFEPADTNVAGLEMTARLQ